ncbi:MAG: hypothetical protein IJX28_02470 [Clostridia bacterium]|nr:hypothetical protein [Clostridia bacterium]
MYSRSTNPSGRPIRIPEHYSGSAFATSPPLAAEPLPKRRLPEVATPSPPKEPPVPQEPPRRAEEPSPAPTLPLPLPPPHPAPPAGGLGISLPFLHGIHSDDLLLLGLILLLAQNQQDTSTLLWLALLLFCG